MASQSHNTVNQKYTFPSEQTHSFNKRQASSEALTLADDEAGLHGGDGEGELLQASGGAHVPVALAATSSPAAPVPRWPAGLDTPQEVRDNVRRVLGLLGRAHDLGYPLRRGAIVLFELDADARVALDLLDHLAVPTDDDSNCEPGHRDLGGGGH